MRLLVTFLKAHKGITALLITLFVVLVFFLFQGVADHIYRGFFFFGVRNALDYTIGLLPFPGIYLLAFLVPFIIWWYLLSFKTRREKLLFFPINLLGWIFSAFMWLWGFNYQCSSPFPEHDAISLKQEQLIEFGHRTTKNLLEFPDDCFIEKKIEDSLIHDAVVRFLEQRNMASPGQPRYFEIGLNGFMRKNGVAGIYLPFSGQAHVDASFLSQARTFILAHELAHAYGVSAESDADFVAYMSLVQSDNVDLKFAAQFELLRSIRSQLYFQDDSLRIQLDSLQRPVTLALFQRYRENSKMYPEYFPGLQEKMNDQYLKLMGVDDGILNYDHFIDMVWESRQLDHKVSS
ncbi:MAG: DUF3810 family protein [Flavobacteriales bacterium]|nr:DUF3810 family protein [Flavobacteriales bacterium]